MLYYTAIALFRDTYVARCVLQNFYLNLDTSNHPNAATRFAAVIIRHPAKLTADYPHSRTQVIPGYTNFP
jgi:hypothetical protein